jgi:hypothetical protein
MLDLLARHPFEACAAFAVQWLGLLAAYDLAAAEALVDANDSGLPFAASFPAPEGFTYCHPDRASSWTLHIVSVRPDGFGCDFEVPFAEKEYRPMMARFWMKRHGNRLEVRFTGLVPS